MLAEQVRDEHEYQRPPFLGSVSAHPHRAFGAAFCMDHERLYVTGDETGAGWSSVGMDVHEPVYNIEGRNSLISFRSVNPSLLALTTTAGFA